MMIEWISVKDRMPKKAGDYLCCVVKAYSSNLSKCAKVVSLCEGFGKYWNCPNCTVTHWAELPKLPEVHFDV